MPENSFNPVSGKRLIVMANAKSGRGTGTSRLDDIMDSLKSRGADAELRRMKKGENFAQATRDDIAEGADFIVAAGGDGTMSGVAGGLVGTDTPMAILPLGTFNYFARSLGISEDLDDALDVVTHGVPERTNTGWLNGEAFLNNASIVIYPQILRRRESTYARWGAAGSPPIGL